MCILTLLHTHTLLSCSLLLLTTPVCFARDLLHNTGPSWASIHCTMHTPKRRESELLPARGIGGFEADSEKCNSLLEVIGGHKASEILPSTLALGPSTFPATLG